MQWLQASNTVQTADSHLSYAREGWGLKGSTLAPAPVRWAADALPTQGHAAVDEGAAVAQLPSLRASRSDVASVGGGRDGLHFVRPIRLGRQVAACLSCHEVHASHALTRREPFNMGSPLSPSFPLTPDTMVGVQVVSLSQTDLAREHLARCVAHSLVIGVAVAAVLLGLRWVLSHGVGAGGKAQAWALRRSADRDDLTHLPRRQTLERKACHGLAQAALSGDDVAVLLVDLDRFKALRGRWGRATADGLLRMVARRLHGVIRPSGILGRWGLDEFAVLLPRHNLLDAVRLAQQLVQVVGEVKDPHGGRVSISVGAAQWVAGEPWPALLRRAARSLHHAQQQGRSRVSWVEGGGVRLQDSEVKPLPAV